MTTPVLPTKTEWAAVVTAWLSRRLRTWAGGDAEAWRPLLQHLGAAAEASALLAGLLATLGVRRQLRWLDYVSQRSEPWATWSADGLTFAVDRAALVGDAELRRPQPVEAADVLPLLESLAGGQRDPELASLLLQTLRPRWPNLLAPLAALAGAGNEHKEESEAQQLLAAPTPAALVASLRQLLDANDPALGCLTPRTQVRLFRHGRELAAVWVASSHFDQAQATVEALRLGLARQPAAPLSEVCKALEGLGAFTAQVSPWLAGPAAGRQRQWARCLFDNWRAFAQLAACLLDEPEQPQSASDSPLSTPADATEATLQELAGIYPVAEQFLTLMARVQEVRTHCVGSWPEAETALGSLHYPTERFKKSLLRTATVTAEEQERQVRAAGRALADDLMNKIRAFDALLPGKSSEGPLPARTPAQLGQAARDQLNQQLRGLRDLLLAVMRDHGGYDEYPVALGDSLAKHGAALEDVTFVATTRYRANLIFQILTPGYVRYREGGKAEVIRSAKVCAAR